MIRLTLFLLILLSTILYSESIQGVINSRVFLSACDLNISPKTKYSWSLTSAPESVINNLSENSLIESLDFSCLASFKTDIVGNYLVKVVAVDLIVNQIKEKEFNIDIFENLEKNNYNFNLYKKGLKERYSIEYLNDLDNEIVSPEKKDQSIEVCFNDLIAFKEIFGEATIKIQNLSDKTDEVISSKNRVYLYKNQLYSLSILYFDSNIYKTIIYENYYPEDFLNIFSSENREVSNQKTESPEISIYSNNIKIRGIFTYFFESSKYSTIYPTLYSSEENFEILFTPFKELYNIPNIRLTKEEILANSEIYYKNLNYIQLNLKTDRYSLVSIKSKNSFSCLDSHPAAQCGLYLSYFFEGDLSLNIPEGDYIINYGEAKNIENSLEISLVESQTVTLSFSPKADKIPVVTPENSKLVVFDDGKNIYSFKNGEQIKVYPNSYNIKVYYDNGVIELKNIEISPNNQTIPIITNQKTAIFSDESGFIFLNSKFYLKIKNSLPIIF